MNSLAELMASSGVAVRRDDGVEQCSDGTQVVYLHAGHLHASREPVRITTILGSCVSVCLWDPVAGAGGMNHYMLPDDVGANTDTLRHATFAIRTFIAQLERFGARRGRLQAKLYGGASIIATLPTGRLLGQRNVDVGRARLAEEHIPVVEQDTGSNHGRKVSFSTATGLAIVKRV